MGQALSEGTSLALLIDQNDRDGVFVPFLGREAATTPAIGVLTRRYKVPVIYLQARRIVAGKRYSLRCEEARLPWGDDIRSHVQEVTQLATARIESMVRETPADWLWMHQRWKVRPDGQREKLI
jgi:KDO2-lipid IV(A) lauroyltransferase